MGDNSDCTVLEFPPTFANKRNIMHIYMFYFELRLLITRSNYSYIHDEPDIRSLSIILGIFKLFLHSWWTWRTFTIYYSWYLQTIITFMMNLTYVHYLLFLVSSNYSYIHGEPDVRSLSIIQNRMCKYSNTMVRCSDRIVDSSWINIH